jgi:2-phosphoglycerate kinase
MASDEEATDRRRMRPALLAPALLAPRLRHVRWIGGGSGAGKSTVARQLAADHGLRLYRTDDTIAEHVRRSRSTDTPLLDAFLAMDMDERWANRSPEVMLKTFPWFAGEGFDLIMEDLLALAENPLVLAEGFRLLPRLVAPLLSRPNQAVWLVPTPAFRRAAFDSRGTHLGDSDEDKQARARLVEPALPRPPLHAGGGKGGERSAIARNRGR